MATTPAFELKGTVSTLTVLRLRCTDLERIGAELGKKVTQLPHFFLQAPVVVDVSALEQDESDALDLAALAALLREHKLVPVAASGLGESRHADAAAAGLGLLKGALPSERKRKPAAAPPAAPAAEAEAVEATSAVEPAPAAEPAAAQAAPAPDAATAAPPVAPVAPVAAPPSAGLLITQPVRGGQVVFSPTDLVVVGPVNAGAEVIADGNIHVYGRLSGRALAGAHGDEEARIFCSHLDAELVSVAGEYRRADELSPEQRGKPVQIFLGANGSLVIADL